MKSGSLESHLGRFFGTSDSSAGVLKESRSSGLAATLADAKAKPRD